MEERLEIVPLSRPPAARVRTPGSKSITNRALVLAALTGKGFAWALRGALRSEDTELMIEALRALGFRVFTEWPQSVVFVSSDADAPVVPAADADLFVGNSGTTMRFLTALAALGHGRFRLDGAPRMRQRPIEDLLNALRQLGVSAWSEANNGCPPVVIDARGLNGGHVRIKGDLSSQFLSGLLMAAPFARDQIHIDVEGPLVSGPYVRMTIEMLRQWGFRVVAGADGGRFEVPGGQGRVLESLREAAESATLSAGLDPRQRWLREYAVEPDASAAGYFLAAAAVCRGEVTVAGLGKQSLQGDVRFADVLADMGCLLQEDDRGLTVIGGELRGIDVDMNDISDMVMTLGVVACFAKGPTTIRNVAHIRHKETDRLAALATELRRIGALIEERADGLTITPQPLHGAEIETYHDHRMAMSLALVGLKVPGIVIKNPACAAKTYPDFFADLERLR